MKTIKVSPSDLAYLWSACPRCWFRKVHGLQKPKDAFPLIVNHVDASMKVRAADLCAIYDIPVKSMCSFERVLSELIPFDKFGVNLQISGKVDKAAELTDATTAIFEMKMTEPTAANVAKFKPQVHAYVWALASPVRGEPKTVSRADLFFLEPVQDNIRCVRHGERTLFSFTGEVSHVPVDLDLAWFHETVLTPMAKCAGSLEMPDADPGCHYCASVQATVQYDSGLARLAGRTT